MNLKIGDVWHQDGKDPETRQVTGIVQNPQSLLDEFALVVPGQVTAPSQVTVLFNAPGVTASSLGPNVQSLPSAAASNPLNPETIVLALATVGMLPSPWSQWAASRCWRSAACARSACSAPWAPPTGTSVSGPGRRRPVGVVGALAGTVLGLAVWLAYRPRLESSAHHLIGAFQLPWIVIGPAMALAVVATYFAASRPARAVTSIPVVAALSGRPAPPKQVHRWRCPA